MTAAELFIEAGARRHAIARYLAAERALLDRAAVLDCIGHQALADASLLLARWCARAARNEHDDPEPRP